MKKYSKFIVFVWLLLTNICLAAKPHDPVNPHPDVPADTPQSLDNLWKDVPENKYEVTLDEKLHDADTFKMSIHITELDLSIDKQTIRASNYDSCEVNRVRKTVEITDAEIEMGIKARDFLQDLFNVYPVYVVPDAKRDAYGRMLCKIYIYDIKRNKFIDVKDIIFLYKFDRSQLP